MRNKQKQFKSTSICVILYDPITGYNVHFLAMFPAVLLTPFIEFNLGERRNSDWALFAQ